MAVRFLVVAVMLAVLSVRADAQDVPSDPSQLATLVKPGNQLIVTDTRPADGRHSYADRRLRDRPRA
jgi:hypothetical protein